MKTFIACLGTETNTFSPMPTGLATFEETMLFRGDATMPMGTTVWLSSEGGVDLVLTSKRTQVFHPDGMTQLGIDLSGYRGIVVKSSQHCYAGFAPLARRIEYVAGEGAIPPDFAEIPYRTFLAPYWPRVEDPY